MPAMASASTLELSSYGCAGFRRYVNVTDANCVAVLAETEKLERRVASIAVSSKPNDGSEVKLIFMSSTVATPPGTKMFSLYSVAKVSIVEVIET